jgi:hypothetical protein
MDLAWKACMGVGVAVFLMGMNALAGFHGKGVNVFDYHEAAPAPAASAQALPTAMTTTAQGGK